MEVRLLHDIAQGDKKAFKAFYDLYKTRIYNTALSYLHNTEQAEEITQDVFVTLYQKANEFKGNSKVSTWIYRITINKALNLIDKQNRRPKISTTVEDYHSINFIHPGIQLENQEKSTYLFAAIHTLNSAQ